MAGISLTPRLRKEYQDLFDSCTIRKERQNEVNTLALKIERNRDQYAAVGDPLGIPWHFVGVVHNMEASLNFKTHLHNGDPLINRTVHVPPGRPKTGSPPFAWSESAADALRLEGLDKWTDWEMPGLLFKLEGYNGFGYRTRHPEVLSPYLWSFSHHYTRGKFVSDGTFSQTASSQQCGAAVLLRRMAETGALLFDSDGSPLSSAGGGDNEADPLAEFDPLVRFSTKEKSPLAEELQKALNRFPGIFVKVDGVPGERTSDAFKKVTGHLLVGDPRS
jgi:lysozyme family protein